MKWYSVDNFIFNERLCGEKSEKNNLPPLPIYLTKVRPLFRLSHIYWNLLGYFCIFFSTVCIYIEMILYFLERTESVCFIVFMKCSQSVILCCMYVNFFHSDYARNFIFSENYEVTNNDLLHSVHLIIVFDNVQYVAVFKCYVVLLWKIIVYSRMFIKKLHILM